MPRGHDNSGRDLWPRTVGQKFARTDDPLAELCRADRDGDCRWELCPQILDAEPDRSGRHCPLDIERGEG